MTIELVTDRLVLRPLAPEDFEPHAAMMADPRVARFLTPDRSPQARPAAWRAFASMIGHWPMRGFGFFSAFERSGGQWVGRVGPWMPEGWPGLECGWGVAPAHWGKGYAGEAAIAAIRWVFDLKPDLPRIISLIDPLNEKSQAVARKVGETRTAERFRFDENTTLDVWAADRKAWLKRFG
ncbi:MAG: GNAT family N-acetyltransferase [Parvularculaceae bacterium]|nr:GNAT family N-acetyltransferase [Parvularculaceae bacterium]